MYSGKDLWLRSHKYNRNTIYYFWRVIKWKFLRSISKYRVNMKVILKLTNKPNGIYYSEIQNSHISCLLWLLVFLFKLKKLTRNLCFLDGSYSTHGDVLFYPGEEMYKKGSWKRKKGRTSREKADTRDVTAHNYRLWPNAVLPYTIRYPNISKIFSFSFQNPGIFSNFL